MRKAIRALAILSLVIAVVSWAPWKSAKACCGIIPTITEAAITPVCLGQPVTISGNINGTPGISPTPTTLSLTLAISVTSPSGAATPVTATVTPTANPLQYTYSATFVPTELGVYTEAKTAVWSAGGFTFSGSLGASFTVNNCCGKVTLGGWRNAPDGTKNTFGGVVQCKGSAIEGDFEFQFRQMPANVKMASPTALGVFGNSFAFSGPATVDGGGTFCLFVRGADVAEPGAGADTLEFRLYGGTACGGIAASTLGLGAIDGGNIQLH